ncbi:hypothetical protein Poly24_12170 [Rosistilla carotiformis]|uniref:Uncharacterized protein n=1 Tax=Rosistilla carotiformis TaxID=2528017 RepID=A0A518JPP6_9BACT|nr:hypothetical protein Poly24_12170 [Rosistilla carotiformis]
MARRGSTWLETAPLTARDMRAVRRNRAPASHVPAVKWEDRGALEPPAPFRCWIRVIQYSRTVALRRSVAPRVRRRPNEATADSEQGDFERFHSWQTAAASEMVANRAQADGHTVPRHSLARSKRYDNRTSAKDCKGVFFASRFWCVLRTAEGLRDGSIPRHGGLGNQRIMHPFDVLRSIAGSPLSPNASEAFPCPCGGRDTARHAETLKIGSRTHHFASGQGLRVQPEGVDGKSAIEWRSIGRRIGSLCDASDR